MFYNYWNYLRFLRKRVLDVVKGKRDQRGLRYKFYRSAEGYGDDKVWVTILGPGEFVREGNVAYRVYWNDGTKSRWFIPGINEIGDFTDTHKREVICKI